MAKRLFEEIESNGKKRLFQHTDASKNIDGDPHEEAGKEGGEDTLRDGHKPRLFEQIENPSELSGQTCESEETDDKTSKCQQGETSGDIKSAEQEQQNLQEIFQEIAKRAESSPAIPHVDEVSRERKAVDSGMCIPLTQDYMKIYGMVNRMALERGSGNSLGFVGGTNIYPGRASSAQNPGDMILGEETRFVDGKLVGNVNGKAVLVGNFWVEIFMEIERRKEICDETNEVIRVESERFLRVGVFTEQNQYLGEIRQDELYKFQWILRLSEHRACYEDGSAAKKALKHYLHGLILKGNFSKFVEFTSTGWKEASSALYFVTSDGVVGHPEIPVKSCDGFSFFNGKVQRMDADKAIGDFLAMRKIMPQKPGNVIAMRNYTLMSLMTTIFSKAGYSPKFILAVIGKTNCKKTSCAKVICKLFNRKPDMGVDINFNSTDAAIYDIMERHSDAVVLIDDFVPPESAAEAKTLQNKLEIIERAYGDRSPRKRCITFTKNKDAKQFCPVKGCAVITGETFGGRKSSQSRAIQIHFEEGDVDEEALAYYQQHLEILPTVAEDFLSFVEKNVGYVMETVEKEVLYWRKELKNSIETPRFKENFAMLAATEKIFGRYLKDQRGFTDAYIEQMVQTELGQIFGIIKENDDNLRFCDPFTSIVEAVRYALEKGRLELVEIGQEEDDERLRKSLIETPEYFLITTDKLYECVKEYFAFTNRFFDCKSGRELVTILAQAGAVLERKEGEKKRRTHKLPVKGKVINNRFLYIFKHKMQCVIEFIENI